MIRKLFKRRRPAALPLPPRVFCDPHLPPAWSPRPGSVLVDPVSEADRHAFMRAFGGAGLRA